MAAILSLLVLMATALWLHTQRVVVLPDFTAYPSVQAKKQAFFNYLQPLIERANTHIQRDRRHLLRFQEALQEQPQLAWHARAHLNHIARRYHIEVDGATSDQTVLAQALGRVNVIPSALVLIQAAIESGWGSSKFARLGNNLFGQQCFTAGCGFVPRTRQASRRHEVARYRTPYLSIVAYLNNLNSHRRYRQLRNIRAQLAAANEPLTGTALADGLLAYSERGSVYVDEVKAMIAQNDLE